MRKLLTILFAISFLSVSAQYKSNYTLTCIDTIYYTKATKFNPSSYECKRGIELKKPDRTKEFFKYPVQIEVDGGQVHLYDFEGNSEIFPIIRTIPNSIQEVIQLVKECNAGVDIVDDADSVIGNENTTNVSVTNVDETYTVTITNADGSTVTNTFDIDLFEGVDTTGLDQLICDITLSKIVTNESITTVYNPVTEVYDVVVTDSNGDFVQTTLDIDLFENVDTTDLKQLILDCVPEYETIDYTVTETTTTETINGEEVDICCIYQLKISPDPIKCDTLKCTDEWQVVTNQSTLTQTTPSVGGIILSDTTQIVTSYLLCGELVFRDTSREWVQTECDGNQTCASTYSVFSDDADPQYFFVAPNDVLEFYTDIVIYDDAPTTAIDTNGDAFTITNGTIIASTGGTLVGNTFTPTSAGWSVTITKDVGFDLIITKNNDGVNMDFYVDQMLGDVAKQVVCTPTCTPAVTVATTTNPDAATGIATISGSFVKNGAAVANGECVSLFLLGSNGVEIIELQGLIGDDISTFTNYNPAWFPTGGIVADQTVIDYNKRQFAIDNGLDGTNADSYTVRWAVGGSCAGNMNPFCATVSTQNQEAYICKIATYVFDNSNFGVRILSNDGNVTIFEPLFIAEPPLPSIGGLASGSNGGLVDLTTTIGNPCGDGANMGAYVFEDGVRDWYVTGIIVGNLVTPTYSLIPDNYPTIDAQNAIDLATGLDNTGAFESFLALFRNDIYTNCVGREYRFVQLQYCDLGDDLVEIRLESNDGEFGTFRPQPFIDENF